MLLKHNVKILPADVYFFDSHLSEIIQFVMLDLNVTDHTQKFEFKCNS
jgi:hypothetical protein